MTPLATSIDNDVQQHHAKRPDVPPHFAKHDPAFGPWDAELRRLYAIRDEATPRHTSINPGVDPDSEAATEALRKAKRFARKLDPRFDDETESAVNIAVVAAFESWTGEGSFDTLLQTCVFREVKFHLRKRERRAGRETRFSDLPPGSIQ
jgi:hypothetical protein